MRVLLEFLTEKVDTEDSRAVDVSYKMLELVEKERFMLDEVLQWFEQDYLPLDEPSDEIAKQTESNFIEKEEMQLYSFYEDDEEDSLKTKRTTWMRRIIEKFWGRKGKRKKTDNKREERQENNYQDFFAQTETDDDNRILGNTVFIPWTENCENKLYGIGKTNKNHIDLNHLPVTVGKLAGSVDMVINDQSISRRHVKFARENGKVCMTDLNSTNGTFKNGMRMDPNTSETLEPGDEIRLGKLKFIYR